MSRLSCFLLLSLRLLEPGAAQHLLPPASRPEQAAEALFAKPPAAARLPCRVDALPPSLNFALRYQAGYRAEIPLSELPRQNAVLVAFFRVQPEAPAKPSYFRQIYRFPELPEKTRLRALLDGGFFLGAGAYTVDWVLTDLAGRECRSQWRIELKPKPQDQPERVPLGPGEVASLRLTRWQPDPAPRPYRVAVLLHAAPIRPRAAVLSPFDQSILVTTLTSLFEHTPFEAVSLVAFNLQQQKELFRAPAITPGALERLLDLLDDLQIGAVDLRALQNPKRYLELLADLVNREQDATPPPDAIVFVGPHNRYDEKFPRELLALPSERRPLFFYLRYSFFWRVSPFPDSLEKLVRAAGGRIFNIGTPREFLSALRRIEEELDRRAQTARPAGNP